MLLFKPEKEASVVDKSRLVMTIGISQGPP